MNRQPIILANTRNELKHLNDELQRKCSSVYRLELSQYRFRNMDSTVYDNNSSEYDVLLCLYHNKKCVSSVTGRYHHLSKSIEVLSKTAPEYGGLKFNLYLRSVFMYLMTFVRPTIKFIYSYSVNPISTYVMYKHYHAFNKDLDDYVKNNRLTPDSFKLEDAKQFHTYFTKKYMQNNETAKKELEYMLEDCEMERGEKCSIQDLGWNTEEEAVSFIMTTMNVQAIPLEINLNSPDIKELLFQKTMNVAIRCNSSGGKSRRKTRKNKKHKII
jgi:hypothetical protein